MGNSATGSGKDVARAVTAGVMCLFVANCASSNKFASRVDPKYGVSSSPRVVEFGEPVPKGAARTESENLTSSPGEPTSPKKTSTIAPKDWHPGTGMISTDA